MVMVDAARFLPASSTITKVVGNVWSADKRPLTQSFTAVSVPESNAYSPRFGSQVRLPWSASGMDLDLHLDPVGEGGCSPRAGERVAVRGEAGW